jgi:diaminopimelate decarboxylase
MSKLPAIISENIKDFISKSELNFELVQKFGSPLNLIFPQEFENNIVKYKQVFDEKGLNGKIWFAYKTTKSHSVLEMVNRQKIGVEVSSIQELQIALSHGISGKNIGVSGPLKNPQFLLLAIQHECTIVIDSIEELDTIAFLCKTFDFSYSTKILVRLSGFEITRKGRNEPCNPQKDNSRFGVNLDSIHQLCQILSQNEIKRAINLIGFSFHIDNHSISDRANAIVLLIDIINFMRSLGHTNCNVINIGGGFSIKYIEPENWNAFLDDYTQSIINREPFMFRDKPFGIEIGNGRRKNRGNFYPYENVLCKDDFLAGIFNCIPDNFNYAIKDELLRNKIEIIIEPGKSLMDQTGLTLCAVKGIKETANHDNLLMCDMNISHIFEQLIGSEYAIDPILISHNNDSDIDKEGFYLAGNLCLESDILSWRKIYFDKIPRQGDILTFVNTGGYQMDFIESKMHQMPLARKIAVYYHNDNWQWKLDEDFSMLDISI